jgi:hypothetical protein
MNTNKIIGRFYFKLTDSKNLIGEYSNNTSNKNNTESAVLMPKKSDEVQKLDECRHPKDDKFIGEYFSTWYEEIEHKSVLAVLKIERKPRAENIFSLKWWSIEDDREADKVVVGTPTFWGEGMLCDGILIGDYR